MSKGPKTGSHRGSWASIGLQGRDALADVPSGGGVKPLIRRIGSRRFAKATLPAATDGLPIGTVIENLGEAGVSAQTGILPVGLWALAGDYQGVTDGTTDAYARIILRDDFAVVIPGGTGPRSNFPTGTIAITASHSAFYTSYGDHQIVAEVERSGGGLSAESTSITATLWAHP